MTSSLVTEQLRQLPTTPGVYLMKDTEGNILYVGKAANLHHRVRSYFSARQKLSPKVQRLVARVNELDFFVTGSEQEALILELNLIKRHHPRYNVLLKDDKTFPYLKIDLSEDWPRVYTTRRLEENEGRYFGPFASARSVRQTLKIIKEIFPFFYFFPVIMRDEVTAPVCTNCCTSEIIEIIQQGNKGIIAIFATIAT